MRSLLGKIPQPIKDRILPDLLPEGDAAPEWHLQSWDRTWHRLRKGWSILVFYPRDDTPGCTDQLQEYQSHYARLQELGCEIYGINPAEEESHKAFADKAGLTFPLLTDRGGAVARRYRATVPIPGRKRVVRTVYLINPERKIRLANRGAPAVEAIVRSIEALQQATRNGM